MRVQPLPHEWEFLPFNQTRQRRSTEERSRSRPPIRSLFLKLQAELQPETRLTDQRLRANAGFMHNSRRRWKKTRPQTVMKTIKKSCSALRASLQRTKGAAEAAEGWRIEQEFPSLHII